jgi:hypothetical protein
VTQVVLGYSGWRLPDGFMPQRGGGIAGSLNEAQWLLAPTGRKVIAQGKAKRRPGIQCARKNPSPERAKPAVRQSMRACSALSGLGRNGTAAYPARWRTTQGDRVPPRVALRSTLGYLIKPRWGERSGYGSVLIAHCGRSRLWWIIRDGVCTMALCPNGAQGDSPGQSEAPPWDPVRINFR